MCTFIRPTSKAFSTISWGQVPSRSYSQATGRISFSEKSWASSRRSFCSSVSVKSTKALALLCVRGPVDPAEPIDWSVNQSDGAEGYRNRGASPPVHAAAPVAPRARRSYPRRVPPLALSLSTGEVILIIVFAAIPIALATFVLGAGNALKQIGKGPFAVEYDSDLPQRVSDGPRRRLGGGPRGRDPPDAGGEGLPAARPRRDAARRRGRAGQAARRSAAGDRRATDAGLAEEVRQLVVARNERRMRQGKEPLDVDRGGRAPASGAGEPRAVIGSRP